MKNEILLCSLFLLSGNSLANYNPIENSSMNEVSPISTDFYEWDSNEQKGNIGDIYRYKNPYSNKTDFFRLKSLDSDGKYGFFSVDQNDNTFWEFIGPYKWGGNDRKGTIGDIYIYDRYSNGDIELFKLTKLDSTGRYGNFPADKSSSAYWEYFVVSISNDHKDLADTHTVTKMSLPEANTISGSVDEQVKLQIPDTVYLDNIKVINEDGHWYVINNTFRNIESLSVKYKTNNNIEGRGEVAILMFDQIINQYTKAKISLQNFDIKEISFEDQLPMFSPIVDLGEQKNDCSGTSDRCYNSPAIGIERDTFERTLAYIQDSFNKKTFLSSIRSFFNENCSKYDDCVNYDNNGLSYGYRNYLSMGLSGHNLSMRVVRNNYVEGMGGGSNANIDNSVSTGSGWASMWEGSIITHILPMTTIFHEVAHAYSFGHGSGMTYGFADYVNDIYLPNEGIDVSTAPNIHKPDILIDLNHTSDKEIDLTLFTTNNVSESNNIQINIASSKPISFTTTHLDSNSTNQLSIKFEEVPKHPVYVQVWSDNSTYISTLKVEPYDLVTSQQFEVGQKSMVVLNSQLINPEYDGWTIRSACLNPDTRLATKQDYQELFDKLEREDKLDDLPFKMFLSSDSPSGYKVWKVDFSKNPMGTQSYSMYNTVGTNHGLICVTEP